jgi:1-acyl-sn-glycerol-3-phosphate acyltransferase
MNILKEIFGRIWALWGLLLFVSTMFIAYLFYIPCHFLKEPQKARWHRSVSRMWMLFFLHAIGCPLKVKGSEHFKGLTNCIIVSNHNSLMDVPVTTPFMPRANKTIAKKSLSYVPVFGWIYSFGSVLVDRNDDNSRRKSFEDMKRMLAFGLDMVIYPEGTRNRSHDPLKPFYDGAFRLATDTRKPIVPALVFNTKKVLPVTKIFFMWPHRLEMHFLPAVNSSDVTTKELKEKVFKIMWNYYKEQAPRTK